MVLFLHYTFKHWSSATCSLLSQTLLVTQWPSKETYAKIHLGPTTACSIFILINIWKLHNNIIPGYIYSCNNITETLHIQVQYLTYGGWKGKMRFFFLRTTRGKRTRGRKEKARVKQGRCQNSCWENQAEESGRKQANKLVIKYILGRISTRSPFQSWKGRGFSWNWL